MAPSRKAAAISSLSTSVPQIFNDAQKPNAIQRKHAIALRKIQEQCALDTPHQKDQPQVIDIEAEALFNKEVIRNINRILPIRRKEPHADRIIRFIASFIQYTQGLDAKEVTEGDDIEDTLSSRFIELLMNHMLRGLKAKSSAVRLRCCHIIAVSINSLGEIDEDLYQNLKQSLFERIQDKDMYVRIQAATALSRLQNADSEFDESDGKTITQKLLLILQHDLKAEVRRVVLFNLDQTKETIPYIIERARDEDAITRRIVFLKPMADIQDFRMLTVQERHKLLKWGLNDRDSSVRIAAGKMVAKKWIRHADHNLLEFLERMDVIEGDAAEDMLTAFLGARDDIISSIKFDEQFWDNLSSESAFLARVFIQFLRSKQFDDKLDAILPEVTRHAFIIQNYNNQWQQASSETEGDYEFIVAQLLSIAKCLDYADEVGRRKMFVLLREMLMVPDIPEDHLANIVELFKIISVDERDFTRIMVEIISDIQELAEIDETSMDFEGSSKRLKLSNQTPSENDSDDEADAHVLKKMLSRLKCLNICKHMLERSEESLQDNSTIYGLLNELIVPSVQSKEIVLREEGLYCLGLCCILDKTLGLHNIPLFVHCLRNGHKELQRTALKTLFDIAMTYGLKALLSKLKDLSELRELFELCLDHDSPEIQALAAEGLAKLMLSRVFRDEETLKLLLLLYFFPSTIDNISVQQCLSYFFPVYCHSSAENQTMLSKVAISALEELCATYTDLEKDEKMVPPAQIADMLADWTDPRKIETEKIRRHEDQKVNYDIHADMAIELLQAIYRETGASRKTLCHMLTKLYINEASNDHLRVILKEAKRIETDKPVKEARFRTTFSRFVKKVEEHYNPQDEDNNHEEERADDRKQSEQLGQLEQSERSEQSSTQEELGQQPELHEQPAETELEEVEEEDEEESQDDDDEEL